jgi:hypothetical protein
MASLQSVKDEALTTLLRLTALMVSSDRRYHAPSLEREAIAAVVAKGHQFSIVSAAETSRRSQELTEVLKERALASIRADSAASSLASDDPMLVLREAMIIMIAADEATSALMQERATKSKRFSTHLDRSSNLKGAFDQLAEALNVGTVRTVLESKAGLDANALKAIVAALTLRETRLFVQLYMGNRSSQFPVKVDTVPVAISEVVKRPRGRPKKVVEEVILSSEDHTPDAPKQLKPNRAKKRHNRKEPHAAPIVQNAAVIPISTAEQTIAKREFDMVADQFDS